MRTRSRDELAARLRELYSQNEVSKALSLAAMNSASPFILDDFAYNSSCVLINCGSIATDRTAIQLGMDIATAFIELEPASAYKAQARYNLSNGHAALAFECQHDEDPVGRRECWEAQREQLQILILNPEEIPELLKTEVYTNFGNVLHELGRTIEALDMYRRALAIDPDHPIAAGGAGKLLLDWIGIQPQHTPLLLGAARRFLRSALRDYDAIRRHASPAAAADYESALAESAAMVAECFHVRADQFDEHINTLEQAHRGQVADRILQQWALDGLILTTNPCPQWCPHSISDDIFFDGLSTSGGQAALDRFRELAHTLNQIKEDFAVARYLRYQSMSPELLVTMSSVTRFADSYDHSDFGLASGLLKASIRQSIDLFDKVANFLNRYLRLAIPGKSVSIASVWYRNGVTDPKRRTECPVMAEHLRRSGWMMGIRDVAATLDDYPARSKQFRNKATHDVLLIENLSHAEIVLRDGEIRVDAHEYSRQLLLMAKGAIVNLIAFVQRNEGLAKLSDSRPRASWDFQYGQGISDRLSSPSTPDAADSDGA